MAATRTPGGTTPVLRVAGSSPAPVLEAARDTAESVAIAEVGPTGATGLEPLALATREGTTAFHARPSPDEVGRLVAELEEGTVPTANAHAVVGHDPDRATLPVPDAGPLSVGRRRVLGPCGWTVPGSVEDYEAAGGFVAAGVREDPDAALDAVAEVGLLGRGRGDGSTDEPVVGAWTTARATDGAPVVAVNANEADPNADMDRVLLAGAPLSVLDGALAVAGAVGAGDVVVYLNEADAPARERIEAAAAAVADRGAGEVEVVAGPDEYAAGETTMALEAMEGNDRLEARRRPPMPAEYGLYGRPTVVHTPRTLAQVRAALAGGGFDAEAADPGTRVVTVAGDVEDRATVELPTDGTLARAADAVEPGTFKLACVGGQFGGLRRDLDVPAGAPALSAAGLGTDGVVELFDEGRCAVAVAGRRARFAREENCGRCVPCREGSKQLHELLRGVYDGDYPAGKLRELARVVRETSLCEFGRAAARPVTTAVDAFESEFVAHANGRCPSGACDAGARAR